MAIEINTEFDSCLLVGSGTDQRKDQSFMSLAFVRGNHWWTVDSPHKGPVRRRMFPFDDITMEQANNISHDYYFCDLTQEDYQLSEIWEINFKSSYMYFVCGFGTNCSYTKSPKLHQCIWVVINFCCKTTSFAYNIVQYSSLFSGLQTCHDGIMIWIHFSHYWLFMKWVQRPDGFSPHRANDVELVLSLLFT